MILLQICSDCFLKILVHRLAAPDLRENSQTDWLLSQRSELVQYCNTSLPLPTPSTSLFICTMPLPTISANASSTIFTEPVQETNCVGGQLIEPGEDTRRLNCAKLALKYNVPTGDLVILTQSWDCKLSKPICAPKECQLRHIVWESEPLTW